MLGSEPNVTHCASWQQPCHSGVYSNPALLVTCQHSHPKRHAVNPLDGNSSIRACMGKRAHLCSLTEICKTDITHTRARSTNILQWCTPRIHSLNSHPALWCVLYYSILPFTKANTHTHSHEFTGDLNMHSHLGHAGAAVIWHSGTIGLCFIWCDLTAGQWEEAGGIQLKERGRIRKVTGLH